MESITLVLVAGLLVLAVVAYFVLGAGKSGAAKSGSKNGEVALKEAVYQSFKLINRTQISPNTVLFRFALPNPNLRVGLPVGKHMLLKFVDTDGKPVSRPYTPVSSDDDLGYFDLLIKLYPQGKMSQHLLKLQVGDSIEARGPQGSLEYKGDGVFEIHRRGPEGARVQRTKVSSVGMIAGGSGITPMLQVLRAVHKHADNDLTKLTLLFANVTEPDILCRSELEQLKEQRSLTEVVYTLDKPDDSWKGPSGFVTPQLIREHLAPPSSSTLVLLCGPKPMVDSMEKHLQALGYTEDMIFKY